MADPPELSRTRRSQNHLDTLGGANPLESWKVGFQNDFEFAGRPALTASGQDRAKTIW